MSRLALAALFGLEANDAYGNPGAPTPISRGMMLSAIALAVFAALRLSASIRSHYLATKRRAYWHSTAVSGVHVVVAVHLFWFGGIGLMTWAWISGIIARQSHALFDLTH